MAVMVGPGKALVHQVAQNARRVLGLGHPLRRNFTVKALWQ